MCVCVCVCVVCAYPCQAPAWYVNLIEYYSQLWLNQYPGFTISVAVEMLFSAESSRQTVIT